MENFSHDSLDDPKTLSEKELEEARTAALRIMSTHSKEEALKIFLKDLKPVTSTKPKVSSDEGKSSEKKARA